MSKISSESLQKVIDEYIVRKLGLRERVASEVENARIHVDKKKVKGAFNDIKASLEKCRQYVVEILVELEKIEQKIINKQEIPLSYRTGKAVILEEDLYDELAYQYIFSSMLKMTKVVLEREALFACSETEMEDEILEKFKRISIDVNQYTFLKDAIEAHLEMIL